MFAVNDPLPYLSRDLEILQLKAQVQELRAENSALKKSINSGRKSKGSIVSSIDWFPVLREIADQTFRLLEDPKNQGK